MLYTIESTLGGFGDVLVEIFALPKACHSGSVGVKYLITDIFNLESKNNTSLEETLSIHVHVT